MLLVLSHAILLTAYLPVCTRPLCSHAVMRRAVAPSMNEASSSSLSDLTVYELKAVCRAKGLKVSGRKAELIARVAGAPPGVASSAPTGGKGRGGGRGRGRGRGGRGRGRGKVRGSESVDAPPSQVSPSVQAEPSRQWPHTAAAAASTAAGTHESEEVIEVNTTPYVAMRNGATRDEDGDYGSGDSNGVEVIAQEEAEALEDEAYLAQRRRQRRAKLSQYFTEEFNSVVGALEMKAGEAYRRALGGAQGAAPAYASAESDASMQGGAGAVACQAQGTNGAAANGSGAGVPQAARYLEVTRGSGRRLAWCKSFDSATGRGVLVDLEERSEWPVTSWSLEVDEAVVPPASRVLRAGEFVEYDPRSARELADGGSPAAVGWVRGILGWPLMCEVAAGLELGSNAPVRAR